jgi:type IV pilus assembly protein PilW
MIDKNFKKSTSNGFTIIELLVAVAISSIVLLAVIQVFTSSNKIYTVQDKVVGMQQNVRAALGMMTRDIRMAGLDPTGDAGDAGIVSADNSSIHVRYDYDASKVCNGTSPNEDVNYQYDAADKRIEINGNALTENESIDSMQFTYTLADGTVSTSPADPDEIRLVSVRVCGKIHGSFEDEFSEVYCFNNIIKCRNMGL